MTESATGSSVVVVGPCASGKSTLVRGLLSHGYDARVCAQEHSAVSSLWRHQGRPTLIGLKVGLESIRIRRQARWPTAIYSAQLARLADAYANADLVIDTDELSSTAVLGTALDYLDATRTVNSAGSSRSDDP